MKSSRFIAIAVISLLTTLASAYDLTVIHTNDVHARFEEHSVNGGACKPEDSVARKCYGGVARRMTKVREIRNTEPNTVFVDGGDQFQGTLWFFEYKGEAAAHFMNNLGYDVMALGNHEFDIQVDGLLPFLRQVNASIVSCNIDATDVPEMAGLFTKSVTKIIGGEKIGIVGYTTKDTPILSSPAPLKFNDEVQSVQTEVDHLTSQGVTKIIALGHAGYDVDKSIAKNVQGVDIVVGGHTNTFLYTGTPPSTEVPAGPYPTVVTQTSGDKVLVVQDYTFGKYLGHLKVSFDANGKLSSWDGNPILLNASVVQDNATLKEINDWSQTVKNASGKVIGRTHVYLDGEREHCRLVECNMGNMIADAFVHQNLKHSDGVEWSEVAISIINSGGVRAPIEAGEITVGDVLTTAPFRNEINIIEITGKTLWNALEHSVSKYNPGQPEGRFLQVSGLRVVYNLKKPLNKRVVSAHAVCTHCPVPTYQPLNMTHAYKVVTNDFIASGGDGYAVLRDNTITKHYQGDIDSDLIVEYIQAVSPIYHGIEGRIKFVTGDPPDCPVSGATPVCNFGLLAVTVAATIVSMCYRRFHLLN